LLERLYALATATRPSVPAARLLIERADQDDLAHRVDELLARIDALEAAQRRGPEIVRKAGT